MIMVTNTLNIKNVIFIVILTVVLGCKNDSQRVTPKTQDVNEIKPKESLDTGISENNVQEDVPEPMEIKTEKSKSVDESSWSELTAEDGYTLDIKYATTDNFTKKIIYDCAKCYLRPEAAEKLQAVQLALKEKFGYRIKLFDCFRPRPFQQRLWDIMPDPNYVTPPHKGSMHSRGMAVDLTLVDQSGKELDMGTEFDFFGPEAHQGYNHSDAVKRNRWILKSTMEKHGFGSIRTEWWHYSYKGKSWPLDEWVWECE